MKNVTLLIKPASGACQYNCEYCFYRDEIALRGHMSDRMSPETLEYLIRKAFAAAENQVTFAFQGGEPTLAGIGFFENVLKLEARYARGRAYVNTLQTNGGLIDEDWTAFLKRGGFLVGLSLDGCRDEHDRYRKDGKGAGTYDRTIKAAELLKRAEVPFNVLCVVSKANVKKPAETYEALKSYRFIQFIPCLDPMDSKINAFAPACDDYADFLCETFDLYEKDYWDGNYVSVRLFDNYIQMLMGFPPESCSMNGRCSVSFTVESDGSVYPCDFYCLNEWRLGSINEMSLNELANSRKAKEFVNSSVSVQSECRVCKYYSLCRGGCRRERTPLNRYCQAYRQFFENKYARLVAMKEDAQKNLRRR